jgi:hypothetical protein
MSVRRAVIAFICAALLVALVAANRLVPSYDQETRPISTSGVIGERVRTSAFEIKADHVSVGHTLQEKDGLGEKPQRTNGLWVLVWADLTGVDEPVTLDTAYLRTTDGHRYDTSDRMGIGSLDETGSEPGLTRYGAIGFEIPPNRLAGARLVVGPVGGENRLGAQADIDLGLTPALTRRMVADAPPVAAYDGAAYR